MRSTCRCVSNSRSVIEVRRSSMDFLFDTKFRTVARRVRMLVKTKDSKPNVMLNPEQPVSDQAIIE